MSAGCAGQVKHGNGAALIHGPEVYHIAHLVAAWTGIPVTQMMETEANRLLHISGGVAEGPLVGGNLTLVTHLLGTPFEPEFAGRILFLDGAEFMKGTPSLACSLQELIDEFGEPDKNAAKFKIEAFKPHWELIRKTAG